MHQLYQDLEKRLGDLRRQCLEVQERIVQGVIVMREGAVAVERAEE